MMSQRQPSTLPSQPEPNPRESVNTIMLRSGKGYDGLTIPELVIDEVVTKNHKALEKEVPIEKDSKKKEGEI